MALTKVSVVFSATVLATSLLAFGSHQEASAKSKKHTGSSRGHNYFVPPPPPYAPSILPERMMHQHADEQVTDEVAEKPPVNPYAKYIFTRDASAMPRVVQPNRIVSYNHKT